MIGGRGLAWAWADPARGTASAGMRARATSAPPGRSARQAKPRPARSKAAVPLETRTRRSVAAKQVARQMFVVQTVEIEITQIVVRNLIREHMVDRHQNLMTDGHHRSFGAPSGFQAVVLVAQVGSLGSGGGLRGLHQGGLQIEVTLGDASGPAFAGRFVIARRHAW